MMSEPIPFFGWLQDVEDTEQMLRKQIQIVQAELDRLQQENTSLRKRVEALMEGREFK
jgi:hypothetical protein